MTLTFQQNLAAKVLADNLCRLLSAAVPHPNRTYALGALKPILAGCLLALEHARNQLQTVLDTIACNHCRIQPERSYPRPPRVKPLQHLGYKGA